jgi:hypothetical protein
MFEFGRRFARTCKLARQADLGIGSISWGRWVEQALPATEGTGQLGRPLSLSSLVTRTYLPERGKEGTVTLESTGGRRPDLSVCSEESGGAYAQYCVD